MSSDPNYIYKTPHGRRPDSRVISTAPNRPHDVRASDDAVLDVIPVEALTLDDLKERANKVVLLGGEPISLKGEIISANLASFNTKQDIGQLKPLLKALDFRGADLRYANLGSIPMIEGFLFDATTVFSDTLSETLVERMEKKCGFKINQKPSSSQSQQSGFCR